MNIALSKLLRRHYIDLQGYVSAGMEAGKDESLVFMNANENPFELPGLEGYNRYPEPQPPKLLEAYAALYAVEPDNIVMTRGADEAIVILTKLFCEPHKDAILICPPTFGMYSVDAKAMPAAVTEVPLIKQNGTYALDVENIIATGKKPEIKLIFICSPNNPTGTPFPHNEILKICSDLEGHAIVLLDETYAEFSKAGSLVSKLDDHPNLIILRTLSKSYSLAGMRMGTMLCGDEDFIGLVRSKALDAYPLPRESIEAALKVMSPALQKLAKHHILQLLQEKDRLAEGFKQSTLVRHVYPSDTNFFLVEMDRAKEFCDYCKQNKIILRDFSNKPLTERCLRISAGTPEQNNRLLDLLKKFTA